MCLLKFDYQKEQITENKKAAFEKNMNAKFAPVCELLNKAGVVVFVSSDRSGKLRGLVVVDSHLEAELKRHGLTRAFE